MSTKKARDFLDKEIFVNRSIVTFRSLSRELGIHVNDAKNELQFYYDVVRDTDVRAVPTYLVSGEVPALTIKPFPDTQQSDTAMDLDLEFEEDREAMDMVHQSKVLLVDARALDETKSQFSRIYSVHIYSLSPSRLRDAGLVCTPTFKVQQADAQGGHTLFSIVGKVTGSHVKLKSGTVHQNAASSSKMTLDMPAKVALKGTPCIKAEPQTTKGNPPSPETKEQVSITPTLQRADSMNRPKPSGKLDWSKAKTKEKQPVAEKAKEEKKPKPDLDTSVNMKNFLATKMSGPTKSLAQSGGATRGDDPQRGVKRKPLVDTDPESESDLSSANAKASVAFGSFVKKEVVDSDEDGDGGLRMLGQRRQKRRSTMTSDSEMSLRVMMDIDDEQVDHMPRARKVRPQSEESEESEEEPNETEPSATLPPATSDGEDSDDAPMVPIVPKRQRKSRQVVAVGRNGLRKRRIIKSRTTTDAKGYMQTEDYSSYESVDEEVVVETKPLGKGKGKERKKVESESKAEVVKPKVVVKEESVGKLKTKSAPKTRGAPKRGGLLNFFGPERGKR